jgi:hypothetical protein
VPLARGLRRGRDLEQEQRRKNELCFVYHRESPCRADVADSGRVCCVTGSNGQVVHRDRYRPRELSQANLMTKQIAGERGRIMQKMQARSVVELVRIAEALGARQKNADSFKHLNLNIIFRRFVPSWIRSILMGMRLLTRGRGFERYSYDFDRG